MGVMQRALALIYPDQCLLCSALVDQPGALCGSCWRETPFLKGLGCGLCGAALPGQGDGTTDMCDDCLTLPRPWTKGRAALSYRDAGRKLVLALKHADRIDLAGPAARWMARAGKDVLSSDTLLIPVPAHWTRLVARRYNQAAELARALSSETGCRVCPDGLIRLRRTKVHDGMGVDARFANMDGAIVANPRRKGIFAGAQVCLIDDVMTSGATLAAAASACSASGAEQIFVLVLARVEKSP